MCPDNHQHERTRMLNEPQILPTPPIGCPLQYFKDDLNLTDPVACVCTRIDGPGFVTLSVYPPNHPMGQTRQGVGWAGDDRRLDGSRPFRKSGCWNFIDGIKPRDAMKFHKEILDRRAAMVRAAEEQAERDRMEAMSRHAVHQSTAKAPS